MEVVQVTHVFIVGMVLHGIYLPLIVLEAVARHPEREHIQATVITEPVLKI